MATRFFKNIQAILVISCHSFTIITELLLSMPKLNLNKNIHIPDTILRLTGQHFPEQRKADENAKDKRPSKKCRVCYAKGIRSNKGQPLKTVYICPSQPGLLMVVLRFIIPS